MLTHIYDMKKIGERARFSTRLPKSFIGLLMTSLRKDGVEVLDIKDEFPYTVVTTSLCEVRMEGSWSVDAFRHALRNEYYRFLNDRFDKRVEFLKSKGYSYYKEYMIFATSERSAMNGNGISNGVVMHENDFLFYFNFR